MARTYRLITGMLLGLVAVLSVGCAGNHIRADDIYADDPGFQIDEDAEIVDTTEHRQVLDVLAHYRRAVITKNFGALKRLVAPDYYENAGTTDTTSDDYGADDLPEVFELMAQGAEEIKYNVLVQSVEVRKDRAVVEYQFDYAFQYKVGEEEAWDAGVDVNRLELIQQDGRWRIIAGL
jgi:hypothetical protein